MILKNLIKFKAVYFVAFVFISVGILSCEDDIREVTIYEKGTVDASASVNTIIEGETVDFTSATYKTQTAEWSFPGGSPSSSLDANVTVTYNAPGTYEAKLSVKYIDNTTDSKSITIIVEEDPDAGPVTPPCGDGGTYNIAIATNNVANEAGYIAALEAAGHTVEAVSAKYENLNAAGVTTLNSFDLVIISRNNNSGAYGTDATVRANWMSVTTPVLVMSPYVSRTSRLQLFSTDGGIDTGGASVNAILETHPIFTGIDLTASNTGVVTTGTLNTPDTAGVGSGALIGTDGTNAAIVEWDENTAAYTGAGVHVGKRMYLAGTGTYTYNDLGTKLFLNVIQYIVSGNVPSPCVDYGNTLGIFTERDVTTSNLGLTPTNNGNLVIASLTSGAFEGNNAYSFTFDPVNSGNNQNGFGLSHMSFTTSPLNASAYNYLNVAIKTTTNKKIRVRHNTSAGQFWVVLDPGAPAYGMAWDGAWHLLKIPFDDIKLNGNLGSLSATPASKAALTSFTIRTDDSDYTATADSWIVFIDDIFLSEN
ncbi:PKD domain-containing protein [Confluentibacter citreus]|uniref:PKD domain-containing protein n=1 Tax=Confluentibacter citreus TaxID=2007307 RepID=UPI000C2915AC|nr:PKD domain-containing protein [Confluentibacter citreus]